jgi:hypothetical protein
VQENKMSNLKNVLRRLFVASPGFLFFRSFFRSPTMRGLEASEKIMESCMAINLPLFFDRS